MKLYVSLYIYHFSTVIDFSSENYSSSTGHRNSWYQQRNLQWGCRWWDSNSQPLDYKPSALAIELYSSKAIAGKELSLSSWCIASLYIYHFSTVIDFSSEKYSGSTICFLTWWKMCVWTTGLVYWFFTLSLFIVTVPLHRVIYSQGTVDLSRPMRARRAKAKEGRGGDGGCKSQ